MQAAFIAGRARYRCRYGAEYALANEVDHPKTVNVREDHVLPALDAWLAEAFAPGQLETTLAALTQADHTAAEAAAARTARARQAVADCDRHQNRGRRDGPEGLMRSGCVRGAYRPLRTSPLPAQTAAARLVGAGLRPGQEPTPTVPRLTWAFSPASCSLRPIRSGTSAR